MDDKNIITVSDDEKTSETNEYNPKLDFLSDQFDPLLALNTPNLKPPVPKAKIYDNIHMYKSAQERKDKEPKNKKKPVDNNVKVVERNWLPHQLPIQVERTVIKKNIFLKMENIEGPLSLLKKCKDNHTRIKIWTRHSHGIRGYCLAYLAAFDKHWNLAIEDVTEIWTRLKKRKIPAFDNIVSSNIKVNHQKILPPKIEIIKTTKTTETCSRYVEQLLLRGEHVALIAVI